MISSEFLPLNASYVTNNYLSFIDYSPLGFSINVHVHAKVSPLREKGDELVKLRDISAHHYYTIFYGLVQVHKSIVRKISIRVYTSDVTI